METSLRDVQRSFQEAFLEGKKSWQGGNPSNRFYIYSEGYKLRLSEVLEAIFEKTSLSIDHSHFHNLCNDFIDKTPSTLDNINHYGREFPDFLSQHFTLALSELAQLEWLMNECFHEKERESWNPSQHLGAQPCFFYFQPYLRAGKFSHDVVQAWKSPGIAPPIITRVLIYRKEFTVHVLEVSDLHLSLFQHLNQGKNLLDFESSHPDLTIQASQVQEVFANWVQLGLIIKVGNEKIA